MSDEIPLAETHRDIQNVIGFNDGADFFCS